MSENNGAPKANDKAMQHALLKEKRAFETCERLRAQCKTQASLMCRLFASKLQEQQAICARAISAPPGERAQVQAEADAFGASTRWILEEAAAAGLAQARDKEVESLREENETLRKKVSELETKLERFLKAEKCIELIEIFLTESFEGGRHLRRVEKI